MASGQFTDPPCQSYTLPHRPKTLTIRISRRQLQGLNGCSGWHTSISKAFALAFPYWSSTYSSPLLQASLFLSCSTYPLAIRFLFYMVLRLVLSIFSDEGSFAWSLLLFLSTVFCGDTLASLPAFTASIYGGHVCCSRCCCGTCVSPWLCIAIDLLVLVQVTNRNHYPTTPSTLPDRKSVV